MERFEVGDKVRVCSNPHISSFVEQLMGHVGVVERVIDELHYQVNFPHENKLTSMLVEELMPARNGFFEIGDTLQVVKPHLAITGWTGIVTAIYGADPRGKMEVKFPQTVHECTVYADEAIKVYAAPNKPAGPKYEKGDFVRSRLTDRFGVIVSGPTMKGVYEVACEGKVFRSFETMLDPAEPSVVDFMKILNRYESAIRSNEGLDAAREELWHLAFPKSNFPGEVK